MQSFLGFLQGRRPHGPEAEAPHRDTSSAGGVGEAHPHLRK